jgi:hypothetical protein
MLTVVASQEIGLEVNGEKSKHMDMCREYNARSNHNIKVGNKCLENRDEVLIFGKTLTYLNCIRE